MRAMFGYEDFGIMKMTNIYMYSLYNFCFYVILIFKQRVINGQKEN